MKTIVPYLFEVCLFNVKSFSKGNFMTSFTWILRKVGYIQLNLLERKQNKKTIILHFHSDEIIVSVVSNLILTEL